MMLNPILAIYHQLLMPPRSCMHPKGPEDQICFKLANALRGWTVEDKLNAVWFHPANEVSDGDKFHFGNKLKAMGKVSGVSDYVFGNGEGMYCLEIKSKKGSLTHNQKAFFDWCEIKGVKHAVAKSFEEAKTQLMEWGILK